MSLTVRSGYADETVEGSGAIGDDALSNPLLMGYRDGNGKLQAITAVSGGVAVAGAAHLATGQITASTMAGTLVIARPTRRSVTIQNLDATITVYVGEATVTNDGSGHGKRLKAGESIVLDTVVLIQVIAASGSPVLDFADSYD